MKLKPQHADFAAFPEIDTTRWEIKRLSPMLYDEKENIKFRFEVWETKKQ